MRNRPYFISVVLLYWGAIAHSQNFLELGKQWIFEDMHYSSILFPYSDTTIETITLTSDTIIKSQVYMKAVLSRHPSCWNTGDVEYLREDGEKVYRLSRDFLQDFLMIDFEEEIEYQMLFDNGFNSVDTATVVIDSFGTENSFDGTLLEVQYVRILNNQSYDDDQPYKVYRNIGFLGPGFLFPDLGTGLCDFQDGITLRCLANEQDTIHFTEFDCFELQIINGINPEFSEAITLYPNPATDYVSIPPGYIFLDLIDLSGTGFLTDYDNSRIYLNYCPSGIYIVRFIDSTGSKIYVGLIIKLY